MKKPHFKKKKILFHSCHSRQLSGFGKNCKNILQHLCSTGKYEIVEFANAHKWNDETLKTLPWKCIGSGPDDEDTIVKHNENEITSREMSYGLLKIDEVIKQEKPDIYIGAEDIWAFLKITQKPWWNKINCMLWTTLDSLPLLPEAVSIATTTKHYYTWANFAKKELHKVGLKHTGCLHGAINTNSFYKIEQDKRNKIRKDNNINQDDFVIGFVFRNQIRKSVPNLLEGFSKLKAGHPKKKIKLLLHTGWHEGWDIKTLIKEKSLNNKDILTTYFCENCNNYKIQAFEGHSCDCEKCKSKNTLKTISVTNGPNENQLNEIYNTMDVYCHPFTSGGQEIPIQEAKLCELITLSTNYSCGEDMNTKDSAGLSLDWSEYREPGTQFIKASTCSDSIAKNITKVMKMQKQEKESLGKKAREFIINNYSSEAVGRKLEKILDKMDPIDFDFKFDDFNDINPDYNPPNITDITSWVIDVYRNIFNLHLKSGDKITTEMVAKIKSGKSKDEILDHLKNLARKEKQTKQSEGLIKKEIEGTKEERIAVVCEGNKYCAILTSSVLKGLSELYPDKKIYIITHAINFPVFSGNKYCYKKIPFFDKATDINYMSNKEGLFDICFVMPTAEALEQANHFKKDIICNTLKA